MRNVDNVDIFFSVHSHRAKAERKAKRIYEQAKRIKKNANIKEILEFASACARCKRVFSENGCSISSIFLVKCLILTPLILIL